MPVEQIKEQHPHRGDWLREIVFGLNDGLVTTLVFIMAVSDLAPARLLLIVLGEVLAGGEPQPAGTGVDTAAAVAVYPVTWSCTGFGAQVRSALRPPGATLSIKGA